MVKVQSGEVPQEMGASPLPIVQGEASGTQRVSSSSPGVSGTNLKGPVIDDKKIRGEKPGCTLELLSQKLSQLCTKQGEHTKQIQSIIEQSDQTQRQIKTTTEMKGELEGVRDQVEQLVADLHIPAGAAESSRAEGTRRRC